MRGFPKSLDSEQTRFCLRQRVIRDVENGVCRRGGHSLGRGWVLLHTGSDIRFPYS